MPLPSSTPERAAPEPVGLRIRLTAAMAVGATVAFPLLEIAFVAVDPTVGPAALPVSAAVTACYLPLLLAVVLPALAGRRSRGAWWAVVGIAAVLVAATPVLEWRAVPLLVMVAVPVMLLTPLPVPFVVVTVLAVVSAPLAATLGATTEDVFWYPMVVFWRSTTLFVLVWLVAAARELERVRFELADRALLRERVGIDDELRRSVGVALADLVDRGAAVTALRGAGPPAELPELVAASRRTLAQARQIVRRYQRPALRDELVAAVALLAAAGVAARAELPATGVPPGAQDALRPTLRAAVTRLLGDGPGRAVVLRVVADGDGAVLLVSPDDARPAATVSR